MKNKNLGLLAAISLLPALAAADPSATVSNFRPWDLAYLYPLEVSRADLDSMIALTDTGVRPEQIRAMIDHIAQRIVLPDSLKQDALSQSSVVAGKKILGGPLNDRVRHNSTVPATPVKIVDADGKDQSGCFNDPSAWHAVLMRIVPSRIQPPGNPDVFLGWAKAQPGSPPIDRIIQLRIEFRPFCPTGSGGELAPLEQALHFAYELRPNDPELLKHKDYLAVVKDPNGVSKAVWNNAGDFGNASRRGDAINAMAALKRHLSALSSPGYLAFRKYVLEDLARLAAATRGALPESAFKDLNDTADELRANDVFSLNHPLQVSLAHPALKPETSGHVRSQAMAALKAFAKKYATPQNATAIAGMLTEGGPDGAVTNFSNLGLNLPMPKGADAQDDYKLIHANSMDTTSAALENNGNFIHLRALKTSNFYAQADAIGDQVDGSGFAFRLIDPKVDAGLVSAVDYYSRFSIVHDSGQDQHLSFTPEFPDHGDSLLAEVRKYADPTRTLPSTTSCVSCHLLPRVGLDGTGARILKLPHPNFLLLNEKSMTSRTVRELDREFTSLALEWSGTGKLECDDPKTLRDCLASEHDSKSCFDRCR